MLQTPQGAELVNDFMGASVCAWAAGSTRLTGRPLTRAESSRAPPALA
jgi:hypothetical protein